MTERQSTQRDHQHGSNKMKRGTVEFTPFIQNNADSPGVPQLPDSNMELLSLTLRQFYVHYRSNVGF